MIIDGLTAIYLFTLAAFTGYEVISKVPVYTVAIQYFDQNTGLRSEVAAFVGDMGLLESIAQIVRHRNLRVDLTFMPPFESNLAFSRDRKWLALHSQEQISAVLNPK